MRAEPARTTVWASRHTSCHTCGDTSHILMLRTLRVAADPASAGIIPEVAYDLVEIPVGLLLGLGTLELDHFSARTVNGSSRAQIQTADGVPAFDVNLEGSVEKVQILNLHVDLYIRHGRWVVPTVA